MSWISTKLKQVHYLKSRDSRFWIVAASGSLVLIGVSIMTIPWLTPIPLVVAALAFWFLRDARQMELQYVQNVKRAVDQLATPSFTRPTYADDRQFDQIGAVLAEKHDAVMAIQRRAGQAERAFDAVFAALYGPALQVDKNGVVERINSSVSSIFQISEEEAEGRPLLHVVRDHRIEEALNETLTQSKSVSVDVEVVAAKHPGTYRVRIEPMINPEDNLVSGAILLLFDVTRLRFLERVRSEFVSNISHELRTPITAVKGFIETVLDEEMPEEERQRFLKIVKQEVDRLEGLLIDLLELSLLESDNKPLEREDMYLSHLITGILDILKPKADAKQITIENRIPDSFPPVPINRKTMEQAMFNLVENAIKYSDEGGTVWIDARPIATDYFEITVTDNGPGIPSDHLPRIFQRFHRVEQSRNPSEGGTGLGLAIVHHIIQRHGGSVRAESRLGKGSRFIVMLPLKPTLPRPTDWEL